MIGLSVTLFQSNIYKIIFGILVGVISYCTVAYCTRSKEFDIIKNYIMNKFITK